MKILLDMNIPRQYMPLLEKRGVNFLRWSDIGSPTALDTQIMEYAHENDFVVLTFDLDFSAILSVSRASKPSVVQIRISLCQAEQAVDLIVSAMSRYADELEKGAILTIDTRKARVRLLPLY